MGPRIALSAGGDNKELAPVGLGMEHVDEFMVRLARRLLSEGHLLAFGGALNVPGAELTRLLVDAAVGWISEGSAKQIDVTEPATWPLANDVAWPYYTTIDLEQQAMMVGVCSYRRHDPPGVYPSRLPKVDKVWDLEPEAAVLTADALSHMRAQQAGSCKLRIVWAGKVRGSAGWMPGILEEVDASIVGQRPVLVLGGFGGCSLLIANYLRTGEWPEAFTVNDALRSDRFRSMVAFADNEASLRARYTAVQARLDAVRAQVAAGGDVGGIPLALFAEALRTESPREALRIASQVANLTSS